MQFDVFTNPAPQFRTGYPYVAVLQSDLAETGREPIIAFLAPSAGVDPKTTKLLLIVVVNKLSYALILPSLRSLPVSMLRKHLGNIADHRDKIVSGLDQLFLGI